MATTIGKFNFVGLDHAPPGGGKSFLEQADAGDRPDNPVERLRHLVELNFAHNYLRLVRFRCMGAEDVDRQARRERRFFQPFTGRRKLTERADFFLSEDFHIEEGLVPVDLIRAMRDDLFAEGRYLNPYSNKEMLGTPETIHEPMLYMYFEQLFANANFLKMVANQEIIDFCKEALGPAAALSWAWSWISNPGFGAYQNQNWHRDSAEPLNFLKVFIPLGPVQDEGDGPTAMIPRTSRLTDFCEKRRFSDMEMSVLKATNGVGMIPAEEGDVYFINTYCLHKGIAPMRRRAIVTLLVSLSPSHRTPSMPRRKLKDVPEEAREVMARNKRFFRFLID
jgi:hypothetical protein